MAKSSPKSAKAVTKAKVSNKRLQRGIPGLSFRQIISAVLVLSIGMLGVSGWFWWQSIFTDPDRILAGMLTRSLQTGSVTRNIVEEDQTNFLDQSVRLHLSPTPTAQTVTTVAQRDQSGINKVTTETIGTNREDYARYQSIESPATGLDRNALGNIVNVWSKLDSTGQDPIFLNEALFVRSPFLVPYGNLKKADRQAILNIMKDKNVYSYSKAEKKNQNGRQVMVYDMSIATQGLVEALAAYARLSGLGEQAQLDPKAYADAPPLKVQMTIDILSRDLVSLRYADSGKVEKYQSHGLRTGVPLPPQSIDFSELQKRVEGLQQSGQN